ncbi:unnamed protein product, partial [Ixodes persulcatus]
MNQTVDPCENFYEFACGGWVQRHPIPEDRSSVFQSSFIWDQLDAKLRTLVEEPPQDSEPGFIHKMKHMYRSCCNTSLIESYAEEPLQKVLRVLGGWPVVEGPGFILEILLFFTSMLFQRSMRTVPSHVCKGWEHVLFFFNVNCCHFDIELLHGSIHHISAGTQRDVIKLGKLKNLLQSEFVFRLVYLADRDVVLCAAQLSDHCVRTHLRKSRSRPQISRKFPFSSQTSPAVHSQIDWDRYFNSLLVDKVTPDEPIIVVVPKFVQQFESLILRTPARTVANYMVWWVVFQSYATLGKPWRERLQEFDGVLTGETREMARWEQCMGSLMGYLGIAVSSLYVRHFFQEESKGAALDMVNFILEEFMAILDDIDWMDEQTRQRARAKAQAIQPYIGYPEELLKDVLVEEHYSKVTLKPDAYFENVMRLRKWSTDYALGQLRKPHIKGDWKRFAQVAVVDAYYSDVENCIRIPAGILQGVFFSKDRPSYLNYGAIGSVIGHEITHGFDDEGRQFDKDGSNINWWEPETDLKFRQRAQCIVEQYGNYTVAE